MKKPQYTLIPSMVTAPLLLALVWFADRLPVKTPWVFALLCLAVIAQGTVAWLWLTAHEREQQRRMDDVFSENAGSSAQIIRAVNVPCLLTDDSGTVVWRNEIMEKLYPETDLKPLMTGYRFAQPPAAYPLEHAGGHYQVMSMQIRRKSTDRLLTFQYWLDRTEAAYYERLYEERRAYIALIYVDNFDELSGDRQFHRSNVLGDVERLVADTAARLKGVYRRYENGRYLMIFESEHLKELEEERFQMLEAAHRIETGTSDTVSLSVAVGVADTVADADESARQAMELALGRGGDQAVVKRGKNYTFYGGKHQLDTMQSRVKARLFGKALHQLFENSGDVFIMGHVNPDMDCLGSALGVLTAAEAIGNRAYVVLDAANESIQFAIDELNRDAHYANCLITPEQAERLMKPTSVLVIVDTQRRQTTAAPQLIDAAQKVVLVDHHRRSTDYIDTATLQYLEPRASSASELITEVIQYFGDSIRVPAFVSSTLLAGITVDTKHFAFNVGSRTFEAAGYLRKNGADISMVKQMFLDDMDSFRLLTETVCSAEILPCNVAIASAGDDETEEQPNEKLIAAKAADQLISIRGIQAAFTLGRDNGVMNVSGRSLGTVNTQIICERLGGGGHLTMSGAQLGSMGFEEARALLKERIEEYIMEVNAQ
ncbi:MAG: DHH family phosphoesterase [Clostridia bacterium]|nr:DHH family phosphoesterase [Clostridia bacterium]